MSRIIRKVFRAGNSIAVSIPPDAGLKEGDYVVLREVKGGLLLKPLDLEVNG